jgi:hypothetical protein
MTEIDKLSVLACVCSFLLTYGLRIGGKNWMSLPEQILTSYVAIFFLKNLKSKFREIET